MEPGPPKIVERIVGWLIPPAAREHVVGDLHERYQSKPQYAADVLSTVPLVIVSQILRTSDPLVRLLEALLLYLSYLGAAWLIDPRLFATEWGLLHLAVPAALHFVGVVLEEAYSTSVNWALCLLYLYILPAIGWLPLAILTYGLLTGVLLIFGLHLLFPPFADYPQSVGAPAYWLRRTVAPPKITTKKLIFIVLFVIVLFAMNRS